MTRASAWRSMITAVASGPSRPGMRRSIKVTSGWQWKKACTASRPSAASATTRMSGCWLIRLRRPTRTIGWSSAISTRIRVGSDRTGPHHHGDGGPLTGLAGDVHPGPDVAGPFAQAGQAEVTPGLGAVASLVRLEALPVVAYGQRHLLGPVGQLHIHPRGAG